jgi:hypothetical protein
VRLLRAAWLLTLALGSAFITHGSLGYFRADLPAFVVEKLPLPWEQVWLAALRVHVVAAAFALPGCRSRRHGDAARILFGTWSPPAPGHVCRAAEAVDSAAPFGS